MPIIDQQKRLRQIGRVRIGEQVPTANGKSRPAMRDTFRFTSSDRSALEYCQKLYGGELREWAARAGEYELLSEAREIRVMISTENSISQWYEQWSGGGCTHRCDGQEVEMANAKGERTVGPCLCNPENRACKPTTRVSFMLAEVPTLGLWRLDSKGKICGSEIPAAIDMMERVGLGGQPVFCILAITQQEIKKPGEPARKFAIPTLTLDPNPPSMVALIQKMQASAFAPVERAPALAASTTGPALEAANPAPAESQAPPEQGPMTAKQIHDSFKLTREQDDEMTERCKALGVRYSDFLVTAYEGGDRGFGKLLARLSRMDHEKASRENQEPPPVVDAELVPPAEGQEPLL